MNEGIKRIMGILRKAKQSALSWRRSLLDDQENVVKQAHRDSTSLLRDPGPEKKPNSKIPGQNDITTGPLFDKAVFLMIEREESLLGDILQQCDTLFQTAKQQVHELKEYLENQI